MSKRMWHKGINVVVALVLAVMLVPLFPPATPVAYAHPAVPVIELYTEQWNTTGSTTLTFNKPSEVQVDELLLIVAINDDTSAIAFNDAGKPSGWNFIADFGDAASDSHVGLFWKIADGGEGATETVTSTGTDEWGGWYVRISGVDTTTPINVVGTATTLPGSSVTATSVTTDVDDCLALCFGSFDGGDGNNTAPFSVSGTGWSYEDDGSSGTTGYTDCSGVWGKKSMSGQGSTGDATISSDGTADGMVGAQIAIAPPAGPTLDQNHYRWRNDSYGLNTDNGWHADEDNAYVGLAKETTVRLRAEIANTAGSSATDYQYLLEYSTSTDGPWTTVPVTATTEHFEMVLSGQYNDADDITSGFLTATGTWANGKGVEDPSNKTGNFSLTTAYYTEFEYAIEATTDATTGGTYYLRLTNDGSATYFTYTRYAEVTIYSPPSVDQVHYRWRSDDFGGTPDWYDTDWAYRKKITLTSDTGKIPSTQSNFPVVIDVTDADLRTTGHGGHVQHASGWDIVFTDSDGTTPLDHEITQYTSSSGNATYTAWVEVPSLSTSKVICMYYGKSGVSSDPSTTATWNSSFKMVQHLDETSGTHQDSTANNNDGTQSGNVTAGETGKMGYAVEFDGYDNYINCGTGASLDITAEITLEAWVKKATPAKKNVAEWEPMSGVLIRYDDGANDFGVPFSMIAEMSEVAQIVTIVLNTAARDEVIQDYIDNDVNCADGNCTYLIADSDSKWTRDYGPWFIWDASNVYKMVDFEYNRPARPNDSVIPEAYAAWQGIGVDVMDLIHTGGNWMTDGHGTAVSTELVWEENPTKTPADIDQIVSDYLGIHTYYHVIPDALGEYIQHIDCFTKFLSPSTVMVLEVPEAHAQYDELEQAADYFAAQNSCYGTPYTVVRVYAPDGEGYVNSLILNNLVIVPIYGGTHAAADTAAITAYENAMPGYNVVGILNPGDPWLGTDASHCRAKGIMSETQWDYDFILSKGKDAYNLQMNRVGSNLHGYISDNTTTAATSTPTSWHHYALTFDGTDQKLFIDGVSANTTGQGGAIGSNTDNVTIGGSFGAYAPASDDFFSGIIDEVRISNTARTADWVKTSYSNQSNPSGFYTAASQESYAEGGTWKAAEDTPATGQAIVENVRVKFSIKNTGGPASDYSYRLQVSDNQTSGYSDVPLFSTPGTSVACMATSTYFANQGITTNQLSVPDSLTWTVGKMVEDTSSQTDAITLSKDYFTEVEFNFQFTSVVQGSTTYYFRVVNSTTPLDSYTEVATITIGAIPTWESYSDDTHETVCEDFDVFETEHWVYMHGEGFSADEYYKVIYWDGLGNKRVVDSSVQAGATGNLSSQHEFELGDEIGDWHCTVYYPASCNKTSYSTTDSNIETDDVSYTGGYAFYMDEAAIPEFPTIISAIAAMGLCFGIYWWMRRRKVYNRVR